VVVIDCGLLQLILIKGNCKEGGNKSNNPMQSPLLFVTEPQTRDNILNSFGHLHAYLSANVKKETKEIPTY
jgi:hypothetical protein